MTKIRAFMDGARKDRFALIIPEREKDFADKHVKKILDLYPCTGILVEQERPGIAYHVTPRTNVAQILEHRLEPTTDEGATFRAGVIYAYPDMSCFTRFDPEVHAMFRIRYGKGTLASITTIGKSEREQGEILIGPEQVLSFELVE